MPIRLITQNEIGLQVIMVDFQTLILFYQRARVRLILEIKYLFFFQIFLLRIIFIVVS